MADDNSVSDFEKRMMQRIAMHDAVTEPVDGYEVAARPGQSPAGGHACIPEVGPTGPHFRVWPRLCENARAINRDRTTYSFKIVLGAHIARVSTLKSNSRISFS
jgi:hypothetical protein